MPSQIKRQRSRSNSSLLVLRQAILWHTSKELPRASRRCLDPASNLSSRSANYVLIPSSSQGAQSGQHQPTTFSVPPPQQPSPSLAQPKGYPPPPSVGQPGEATHYPAPPSALQPGHSYPAPPQQQPSPQSSRTNSYPPPPQATSPPLIQSSAQYPPPPSQSPQQQQQHNYPLPPVDQLQQQQSQIPLHIVASPDNQQHSTATPPPPAAFDGPPSFDGPPTAAYPPEKGQAFDQDSDEDEEDEVPNQGPVKFISGAPPPELFVGATGTSAVDDVGTFNGGSYRISHRDSNTILTIQLAVGCPLKAKPGTMIAMSPTVILRGQLKFSMKKLVAGAELAQSTFTGPGQDAYVASTQGVICDYKRQGLGKAIFSGEGLFVYKISGTGLLWITSFGAIIRKDLIPGEKYIVDNGHLVAWNTKYIIERVASGGIISGISSGEGLVCKFTGPGTVYMQTRNPIATMGTLGTAFTSQ
ncbi:DUF124 domain-containing protein [Verticillium alfalfae VaMs.102]|uniref:Altered inheritance of mitochondria protein 24, mitochondrial n=1 Tax=Verticillium alfalfae (strain VaMs.102 / ATCC MYA-4576 / FGSC 10136) TaxID=526221 RepID=C9S5Q7_VERA1|nr:DUF124 domain-containing protein [Verticillium alfalfae VaMs.102]EEY14283.1 DUF124 domain-containing protein [Verticillium alfalfae VaMs.102]